MTRRTSPGPRLKSPQGGLFEMWARQRHCLFLSLSPCHISPLVSAILIIGVWLVIKEMVVSFTTDGLSHHSHRDKGINLCVRDYSFSEMSLTQVTILTSIKCMTVVLQYYVLKSTSTLFQLPDCVPRFHTFFGSHLEIRQRALRTFQQAARKVNVSQATPFENQTRHC